MAGLLDGDFGQFLNSPIGQGLLSAAFTGMATANRGAPLNSIGRAGLGGLVGYSNAADRQVQMAGVKRREDAINALRGKMDPNMAPLLDIAPEYAVRSIFKEPEKPQLVTVQTPNGPMQRWVRPGEATGVDVGAANVTGSGLAQLIREREQLPPMDPRRKMYDQAITKETTFAPPITVQNYPNPVPVMGPGGKPVLAQFGNKGDVRMTEFSPAPEAKPPTEAESKAALYSSNMKAATNALNQLEKEGMNMSALGTQADIEMAGGLTNLVASPRAQQARQAQEQWAESMLRMMTGAAATKDEITRNVRTYFPQPGDSSDVVEQKRQMRANAEQGVFSAAGRAQDRVPSAPAGGSDLQAAAAAELERRKRK